MAYTVLARRYRSQRFEDVIGQDAIAQTLIRAIESERVAHAYLFCGTRGVGKTTMARILAKSLNCLKADGPTVKPCLKCDSCVSVNAGEDIDVIEIDGASNTGVDNIRQLRENAMYRPARARFKIYIIDEVHMLSTGAFNALLKILEEPPEHVKFIFATTEPNKILPTIQSRCQRFDFQAIQPATIAEQLASVLKKEKIKADKDVFVRLSRLANGSMRDGLSLLDQLISTGQEPLTVELLEMYLGAPGSERIYELLEMIAAGDGAGTLDKVGGLIADGKTCPQIAEAMIEALRDVMVLRAAPDNESLVILTAGERERAVSVAQSFDIPSMIYQITSLERIRYTLRNSEQPRALLEATLIRLALRDDFIGADAVLKAVSSGQAAGGSVKKNETADESGPVGETFSAGVGEPAQARQGDFAKTKGKGQVPQVLTGSADLRVWQEKWEQIVEAIKQAQTGVGGYLANAKPTAFEGSRLTLEFGQNLKFIVDRLGRDQKKIDEMLSRAAGCEVFVKLVLGEETFEPPRPIDQMSMSAEQRHEILSENGIRQLLSGFKARVIDITKVREEQ